ncbi:MAG TPA: PHP-associated domain-containing protein [Bryobacteraceae bacterium]|nr:PHP-associated domain-containing protein [Bryobacteraceae bacterium]
MCTVPVLSRICKESYNDPREVYETLKRRGMDFVTVTDHDSIDAGEPLRRHKDFFLSEEVSCTTEHGTELHMGVYGIEERDHNELQRRRHDLPRLIAYLNERGLLFSINHVFSGLTGRRVEADFENFSRNFPAVETRNGQMLEIANRYAAMFAERHDRVAIGGSDAHTLAALGKTYTVVEDARTPAEYLEGLKQGRSTVAGISGDVWTLTKAVCAIGGSMTRERSWTAVLTPLMAAVPIIILVNYFMELSFAAKWGTRTEGLAKAGLAESGLVKTPVSA